MKLDPFSRTAAHLTLIVRHEGIQSDIATATGFFVDVREQRYLVTAWHNLTGRNPADLNTQHRYGAIPTHVRVRATYRYNEVIELYQDDSHNDAELCRRCFWQHPRGPEIDIAVLRVPRSRDVFGLPMERIGAVPIDRHLLHVRQSCYAIGFPHDLADFTYPGYVIPVHKAGTIASEPESDYKQRPVVLIDMITRMGMSGSLVLAQFFSHSGLVRDDQVLGIYAGRYFTPVEEPTPEHIATSQKMEDSGVGYVFKSKAIVEVLNQINGTYPTELGLGVRFGASG
jgi:hypothetical protein